MELDAGIGQILDGLHGEHAANDVVGEKIEESVDLFRGSAVRVEKRADFREVLGVFQLVDRGVPRGIRVNANAIREITVALVKNLLGGGFAPVGIQEQFGLREELVVRLAIVEFDALREFHQVGF